ncbi:hypothetical protein VAE151_500193 [Vibrio aestuarianus]|uniref:Uncharacterized protein n=1 Tax=Vibrio aestuarianus TaxID=28171 RepID=A0ABN8TNC0_9VIBR|nr:hypothetical protein VIBAE_A10193 [Vibrio aestuarianus subsp. francensis]CAH8183499.1 hypothetical protein VAE032_220195 [Vibrio aestuarianus]CAH8183555.1 hypothetical protein VAE055_320195 [Vibrio aestuarianus]CAH8183658.1 hypothetical protein VAE128_420195 [Vibrio aestuarianus]CAH8183827.1 hypothetical protein VAE115_270195 [Vibrio aestuarianus]
MPIDLCETVVPKLGTLSANFLLTLFHYDNATGANCINCEHKLSIRY